MIPREKFHYLDSTNRKQQRKLFLSRDFCINKWRVKRLRVSADEPFCVDCMK